MGLNNPEAWHVREEDPRVARTALHRLIKVRSNFNRATCGGIPDMLSLYKFGSCLSVCLFVCHVFLRI